MWWISFLLRLMPAGLIGFAMFAGVARGGLSRSEDAQLDSVNIRYNEEALEEEKRQKQAEEQEEQARQREQEEQAR